MKTTDRFSIHFKVRTERQKNGFAPIAMGITVNGKKAYMSIKNLQIDLNHWDVKKGIGNINTKRGREICKYLDDLRVKMKSHYRDLEIADKPITIDSLKNEFLGITNDVLKENFDDLFKIHNEQGKALLAKGTLAHYYVTQRYLTKFIKEKYKKDSLFLNELNYRFISDFETFLYNHEPKDHQKRMDTNGVLKHMVRLKKMINLAIRLDWLRDDPFKAYKMTRKRVDKEFLNQVELNALIEKEFVADRLTIVRDLFVFASYTGLAYADLTSLKHENIAVGDDGQYWIRTLRQKTGTPVNTPILPKAEVLLNKYMNNIRAQQTGTVFPVISNQKVNSYLKEIAVICNISKNLTFHVARHTFATTITLSNGVPIETVSKILGHTKLATTQIYARVLENKISSDMAMLREKLVSI